MLDDLVQTIEMLKTRIKEHRAHIGAYEKRTRVALIDPLLCALGWDVSDPELVEVEFKTEKDWADYALLGTNRKPVVFVEAKSLKEDINSHIPQTIKYAIGENFSKNMSMRYCVVTNGDDWKVLDLMTYKPAVEASIAEDKLAECALKLLGLWRRSLQDGSLNQAIEPLFDVVPQPAAPPSAPVAAPASVVSPPPPGWTPLSQIPNPTHQPAPKAIGLPDGERTLTTWRGVLAQTGLWLYREGVLTQVNCEVVRRGKHVLFSLSGLHPAGDHFKSPVSLEDTGIIMEGSLSARASVRLARKLLEHFGRDPSQVTLKLQ